uniref:M28 family metallopeptidase n=1 Tax=Novosphingobium sp. TaxID=1874826 RepID=UPI0035621F1E
AVMLDSLPAGTDLQKVGDRAGLLLDAGALAVITVLDGERGLEDVIARRNRAGYAIAGDTIGDEIEAFMSVATADMLLAGSQHGTIAKLRADAGGAQFAPYALGINSTFEATSRETRIRTHNLIGRIPGRSPSAGAVLMMAHWDHFGECAQAPAEDLICNGAIDNASGLAVVTEAARILAKGRPMDRDVYIVATTGEELGLLGALAFAENPPIPLDRIVAAFNVDSTGLVPPGGPIGIVGKGLTPLDPLIGDVVRRMKRKLAQGNGPNAYIKRQDSWALMQHDVPAVMVSSSYGDMERIERFMEDTYHRPLDQAGGGIDYAGMADDVALQVELVRAFADSKRFPARETLRRQTP